VNIFLLSKDPMQAAQQMCDRHINKMIVESCQMMSTAMRSIFPVTYKTFQEMRDAPESLFRFPAPFDIGTGHYNHPCTMWVRKNEMNLSWLASHTQALIQEKRKRWDTSHLYSEFVSIMETSSPKDSISIHSFTPVFSIPVLKQLANRSGYQNLDAQVVLYRMYYVLEKYKIARWEWTPTPTWWKDYCSVAKGIRVRFPDLSFKSSPTLCGALAKEIDNFLTEGA
jgi:hypothetical protein